MCVCVPSHRQDKQVWSVQKPVGRLDAINTFVIFPDYNVGLYSPRSEPRNATYVILVVPARACFPIVNLPKCNFCASAKRYRDKLSSESRAETFRQCDVTRLVFRVRHFVYGYF